MDSVNHHFKTMSLTKPQNIAYSAYFSIKRVNKINEDHVRKLLEITEDNAISIKKLIGDKLYIKLVEYLTFFGQSLPVFSDNGLYVSTPISTLRSLLTQEKFLALQTPFSELYKELINKALPGCYNFDVANSIPSVNTFFTSAAIFLENSNVDSAITLAMKYNISREWYEEFPLNTIFVAESRKEELINKLTWKIQQEKGFGVNVKKEVMDVVSKMKSKGAKVMTFIEEDKAAALIFDVLPDDLFSHLPIIYLIDFRTAAEAARLAKNRHNCSISIWGENISLVIGLAKKLDSQTVWINHHGKTDIRIPICQHNHTNNELSQKFVSSLTDTITLPCELNIIARQIGTDMCYYDYPIYQYIWLPDPDII